jgi:predicted amidophosphoribosyltransferase
LAASVDAAIQRGEVKSEGNGKYQVGTCDVAKAEVDRWRNLCAAKAKPISANGEVGRGRKNSCDNVTPKERGNSAEYLLGRLKRDHPEIVST